MTERDVADWILAIFMLIGMLTVAALACFGGYAIYLLVFRS